MAAFRHEVGLAIHLEPATPIMLPTLLKSLKAVGDEYSQYSRDVLGNSRGTNSKLFVGSVKPGSIDILLQPDLLEAGKLGLALATAAGPVEATKALLEFGNSLDTLLTKFQKKPEKEAVSIKDCDNAINIVSPVVESGGSQTINVIQVNGDTNEILKVTPKSGLNVLEHATATKAELQLPVAERHNAQALIWKTVDRSPGEQSKINAPDKALIEELDSNPHSVLFGDDASLKVEVLSDDENPMQMIYYVDVEIVRVAERIKAYRIVGFHGKEAIDVN